MLPEIQDKDIKNTKADEEKKNKSVGFKIENPDVPAIKDEEMKSYKADEEGKGDKTVGANEEKPDKLNTTKGQGDIKLEANAEITESKETKKEAEKKPIKGGPKPTKWKFWQLCKKKKPEEEKEKSPKRTSMFWSELCTAIVSLLSLIFCWILARIAQIIAITGVLAAIAFLVLAFLFGTKVVSEMQIAKIIIKSFCLYQPKVWNCDSLEQPNDLVD